MDIFSVLTMVGGLALFLYGMQVMGDGLAKVSGGKLERILENLTSSPIKAVLLGAGVTAVIQSSSATTVMVVGFVNSGIMKLNQAVGIIMGANIGTTVTSWILSLSGLQGDNIFVKLCKPSSFSPILAVIGVVFLIFLKDEKKKDIGTIMVGFAVLMFGMETMSDAVKPLANVPEFTGILTAFSNPILGDRRSSADSDHSEFFRFRRYPAGALCDRSGKLRGSDPDHHGTEYRYLCDRPVIEYRSKQKCKTCRYGTSVFQYYRNGCVHGDLLFGQCSRWIFFPRYGGKRSGNCCGTQSV